MFPGGIMTLDGRVAIITGASRGIGLAIATRFHQAGARVGLCARSADQLKHHEQAMGTDRVLTIEMDVRDSASVAAGIERLTDRFGDIDIVVNNAGISGITPIDDAETEPWLDIMQTNL